MLLWLFMLIDCWQRAFRCISTTVWIRLCSILPFFFGLFLTFLGLVPTQSWWWCRHGSCSGPSGIWFSQETKILASEPRISGQNAPNLVHDQKPNWFSVSWKQNFGVFFPKCGPFVCSVGLPLKTPMPLLFFLSLGTMCSSSCYAQSSCSIHNSSVWERF